MSKNSGNLADEKILVTGGAGFIGSHLVDRLVDLESRVTVVDDLSYGKKKNMNEKVDFKRLDIRNYENLKNLVNTIEPQAIFHLAANATTRESSMGWKDPIYDYEVNTLGTLNILRALVESEIHAHLLYASSAAVYGEPVYTPIDEEHPTNPKSPYGISKLTSEKYLRAYHKEHRIPTTIFRIFNCYGPRQPRYVMYDFLKKLKDDQDKLEVLGTGEQIRTYCYISDAIRGLIEAFELTGDGSVYNFAGESRISIGELAELMIDILDLDTEIEYTGETWEGDIIKLAPDTSKIRKDMGFKPTVGLREGLKKLIDYFESIEGKIKS